MRTKWTLISTCGLVLAVVINCSHGRDSVHPQFNREAQDFPFPSAVIFGPPLPGEFPVFHEVALGQITRVESNNTSFEVDLDNHGTIAVSMGRPQGDNPGGMFKPSFRARSISIRPWGPMFTTQSAVPMHFFLKSIRAIHSSGPVHSAAQVSRQHTDLVSRSMKMPMHILLEIIPAL